MDAVISAPMTTAEIQRGNIDDFWTAAIAEVAGMRGVTEAQLADAAAEAFPKYTRSIALQVHVSQVLRDAASTTNGRSEGTQALFPMDEE
jgi:hypothetical protein